MMMTMLSFVVLSVSVRAPIEFLRLVFAAIAAYFLFGDVSGVMTWVGACVIFLAAYYTARKAHRTEQAAKQASAA